MSATNQNLTASVSPLVSIELHDINGKQVPAVTSLQVAEAFGKEHFQVMRDIRNLLESDDFSQSNFVLVHYMDAKGEERPMYVMSRDVFVLLGMGFTGAKARALPLSISPSRLSLSHSLYRFFLSLILSLLLSLLFLSFSQLNSSRYKWKEWISGDIIAGLTVGIMHVPQGEKGIFPKIIL